MPSKPTPEKRCTTTSKRMNPRYVKLWEEITLLDAGDDERTRFERAIQRGRCEDGKEVSFENTSWARNEERGEHGMTKYQTTQAEEALGRILDKVATKLSEPAHDLLSEAMGAAYAAWLEPGSPLQLEEYEETDKKLCSAAAKVTDQDRELLGEVARAHKAASVSIDPDDDTHLGYGVYQ